ncbi:unnamed protein product [Somion occarium]|uniref:Uncharacterized protein n=1 Tax=Somion occarium TaxID=3059160 RepID=A0ABP1CZR4_9APHY
MEEIPNEDDVDLETLQAQIDLSLAHTKDLVSSWLKPTYGKASSSVSRAGVDKEIEEILRRPPRLGVGAPIPASTGTLGHESVKLKNKLSGKKRQREEESTAGGRISEDEEESRAGAIKKKAKVDPFGGSGKKKKSLPQTLTHPEAAVLSVPVSTTVDAPQVDSTGEASKPVGPATQTIGTTSLISALDKKKKKKKKKKHKDQPPSSDIAGLSSSPQKTKNAPVIISLLSDTEDVHNAAPSSAKVSGRSYLYCLTFIYFLHYFV